MMLHLLDTPKQLPQTMAFAVDAKALDHFRRALRSLLETGKLDPLCALWDEHVGPFDASWTRARYRVDAAWLRGLCEEASSAAAQLGLPVALKTMHTWLAKRTSVELWPPTWLALAEQEGLSASVGKFVRAGAPIIAQARLEALVSSLKDARTGAVSPPELLGPEGDFEWVRALRFHSANGGAARKKIVDPIGDVVVGLMADTQFARDPVTVLERVRGEAGAGEVLALLIGAHVQSAGPGPFLPAPPQASPMEDTRWRPLPLFSAKHWAWPLVKAQFLVGKTLGPAAKWVQHAEPDRSFHADFNVTAPTAAVWKKLVREHWPRCRDRFVELLLRAEGEGRAVVLLDAELSHSSWVGAEVPPRS